MPLRGQDRRREPVAGPAWCRSPEGDGCVIGNVPGDRLELLARHQRSHLGVAGAGITDDHSFDRRFEQLHEAIKNVALHKDPTTRATVLTGIVKNAVGRGGRRTFQIAVIEDDVRALSAEFQGHPLDLLRGSCHHTHADLGGAGEDQLANIRMGDQSLAHHRSPAGQYLEQIRWQARFHRQFAETDGGQRSQLGRFEHHGVTSGQCRCESPRRDGHGEVPRGDHPDDAHRLVERDVEATRDGNLPAGQPFRCARVKMQHIADMTGLPLGRADGVP